MRPTTPRRRPGAAPGPVVARQRARASGRLPRGMVPVGVGIGVSGLCAYAFLAITARWLGPDRDGPLATFWSVTFLIGPGCFSSLEKEMGRLISGHTEGAPAGPVARRGATLGAALTAIMAVVALGAAGPLTNQLFGGSGTLLAMFVISLVTIAVQYLALGVLAGNARFAGYGLLAGAEGVIRLVGGAALVVAGATSLGWYGVAVAVAPGLAVLVACPALRGTTRSGVDVGIAGMARSVAWLVVATLLTAVLVGSGPVTVELLGGGGHPALTARLLSALVLVRVPLFLYTAGAATLLPALARHLATGDLAAFRAILARMVAAVAALGVSCVALAWVTGPPVLGVVFGSGYRLPGSDLAILAGSAAFLLVATTLSTGLTALGRSRQVALCWGAGVIAMVVVTATVADLLQRVELGLLAGGAVAAVAMVPGSLSRVRPVVEARVPGCGPEGAAVSMPPV